MSSEELTIVTALGKRYEKRFWARVQKTDTCWLWTGGIVRAGYGYFYIGRERIFAHRLSFEIAYGRRIGIAETLDHLCRVKHCVNPAHLEPVSSIENTLRGMSPPALNALKIACNTCGMPYDEETYVKPATGYRECRHCLRKRNRQAYYVRKEQRGDAFKEEVKARLQAWRATNRERYNAGARRQRAAKRQART